MGLGTGSERMGLCCVYVSCKSGLFVYITGLYFVLGGYLRI